MGGGYRFGYSRSISLGWNVNMDFRNICIQAIFFNRDTVLAILSGAGICGKEFSALFSTYDAVAFAGNVIMEYKIMSETAVMQLESVKGCREHGAKVKPVVDNPDTKYIIDEPLHIDPRAAGVDSPSAFYIDRTVAQFFEILRIIITVDKVPLGAAEIQIALPERCVWYGVF